MKIFQQRINEAQKICHAALCRERKLLGDGIRRRKRKPAVCILALCMPALLLIGCGGDSTNQEEASSAAFSPEHTIQEERSSSEQKLLPEMKEDAQENERTEPENAEEASDKAASGENHKADTDNSSNEQPAPLSEEEKEVLRSQLIILQDPSLYSYQDMLTDTEVLLEIYPDLVAKDSIGTTADGRELVHYIVGNPAAEKQIFINGAIHAREYLTFQLVMKQMCEYLRHVDQDADWGGRSYRILWDQVAIHVVPLVNPDGVQISQFGLEGLQNQSLRDGIYNLAANDGSSVTTYYLDHWKANASGVDLNRNFDAYWEYYQGTGYPSSDHYKGEYPGSEPEAAALIRLTEENNFLYTISYHTQGQVIYWNFENIDPVYDVSLQWVNRLTAQTGYSPVNDFSTVDPAGYSDWAIYRHQIPSVVIEVASGESPYLSDQFQQVWYENLNIWEITAEEALIR